MIRILGIDPGLQKTGWGVIEARGNQISFIATGLITTSPAESFARRLLLIDKGLTGAMETYDPSVAAVEEVFVNKNPQSTLKLGMARGAALSSIARRGIPIAEYAARFVKKAIVGSGRADKNQISFMIAHILRLRGNSIGPDQADALAVALCHANYSATGQKIPGSCRV